MIEDNIIKVFQRTGTLKQKLDAASTHISKYIQANNFVELTQEQKVNAILKYNDLKEELVIAWNSLVEAETATEEIVKEE